MRFLCEMSRGFQEIEEPAGEDIGDGTRGYTASDRRIPKTDNASRVQQIFRQRSL